jgi:hypothetical protein
MTTVEEIKLGELPKAVIEAAAKHVVNTASAFFISTILLVVPKISGSLALARLFLLAAHTPF